MKTKPNMKQGKKQMNLPGRAKKPVSPNFGEKPMSPSKKGGKKGSSNCY